MIRIVIPMSQKDRASLLRLEKETGRTRAQVIHDALEAYATQAKADKERRLADLRSAFGMWKDRDDLPDFEEMRKSWDRVEPGNAD